MLRPEYLVGAEVVHNTLRRRLEDAYKNKAKKEDIELLRSLNSEAVSIVHAARKAAKADLTDLDITNLYQATRPEKAEVEAVATSDQVEDYEKELKHLSNVNLELIEKLTAAESIIAAMPDLDAKEDKPEKKSLFGRKKN